MSIAGLLITVTIDKSCYTVHVYMYMVYYVHVQNERLYVGWEESLFAVVRRVVKGLKCG